MQGIVSRVRSKLQTDFERGVFDASLSSFAETTNPLRVNNFAYAVRELSRHVLKRLAPDENITGCCWYKPYINERGKAIITRTQRVQFSVRGGLPDSFVVETLEIVFDEMLKNFNAAIKDMSKLTHIEENVFALDNSTADRYAEQALEAFDTLFSTIDECRSQVTSAVESNISKEIFTPFIEASFNELDEVATHHIIEFADVESIHVGSLNHEMIEYNVNGYIECSLQYGSSSDRRRGEGETFGTSFPFSCRFGALATDPLRPRLQRDTLKIDNCSWYEQT